MLEYILRQVDRGRNQLKRLYSINNFDRGIFRIIEEILCKILDSVNQIDIIHLRFIHRFFQEPCRVKLLENIHVYNDGFEFHILKYW
ncbi:hypothetical protein Cantr_07944 [Candida viswanathii]|uniref:Uncharacterized protein n=1 Tax=Candida viswanathii TaxID=5486 RepID=A0A367Y0B6_9ASCO|nr:hypothetical protein Cantr_07944 [Candida viswanathii]